MTSKSEYSKELLFLIRTLFPDDNFTMRDILKIDVGSVYVVFQIRLSGKTVSVKLTRENEKDFQSELWGLYNLRDKIPCPQVIAHQEIKNKKLIKSNYIIETYISGINSKDGDKKAIYTMVEQGLVYLHQLDGNRYGKIDQNGKGSHSSWSVFLNDFFNTYYTQVKKNTHVKNTIPDKALNVHRYFVKRMELQRGKLIHGELHGGNFKVSKNKKDFLGFLDLKNLMSGDPLWDFAKIYYYNNFTPWPSYIQRNNENIVRVYYYLMLIQMYKLWLRYRMKSSILITKKKLISNIETLEEVIKNEEEGKSPFTID